MCDKKIDTLYGLCFNQMVRCKISPTYVERRILDEIVICIKTYLLQFVDELRKKVFYESKRCSESYLTWDSEFYKKDGNDKEKILADFENLIKNTETQKFLAVDCTKTYSNIDILYPNFLPTSDVRVELLKQWEKIKDKHD